MYVLVLQRAWKVIGVLNIQKIMCWCYADYLYRRFGFWVCDVKLARNIWRMFCYITTVDRPVTVSEKVQNIIITFQQAINYRVKVSGETLFVWLSKHPSTPSPQLRSETATYFIVLVFHTRIGCGLKKFMSFYKTFTPFLSVPLLFWYFTQIKKLSPFHMLNMLVKTETELFYWYRN